MSRLSIFSLIGMCLAAVSVQSLMAASWQRIAGEGYPIGGVPGQPAAEHFILSEPTLNGDSQVAFQSRLSALSVDDDDTDTIWAGSASQPQLVARQGDIAPGTTEEFLSFDHKPLLNNSAQVLISAHTTGNFDQNEGLWTGSYGALQLLARTNVTLPGLSTMIDSIDTDTVKLSDSGKAAFLGTDANSVPSLWYGIPGSLSVLAKEGNAVPGGSGLPSNVSFQRVGASWHSAAMNASGTIAFNAKISNPTLSINGESIWIGTPGNLQLLVREDMAAPGVPGEEFFFLETHPVINTAGQVAFGAELTNFNDSIWVGTPGNLQMILEGNDPAPVGSAGVRFADSGFSSELRFSDSGHVGFEGWLEGAGVNGNNDYGLFRASSSSVDMVARMGSPAPGMGPGAVFQFFEDYSMNATGQMAFMGSTVGGSASASQRRGIWAQNAEGKLELVVRVGDWVHPVTGNVVRLTDATNPALLTSQGYDQVFLLDWLSASTIRPEQGTAWNAMHQIAFSVTFTNSEYGTVLFLADLGGVSGDFDNDGDVDGRDFLVWQRTDRTSAGLAAWQQGYGQAGLSAMATVPEPSAIILLAAGLVGLSCRRYLVR